MGLIAAENVGWQVAALLHATDNFGRIGIRQRSLGHVLQGNPLAVPMLCGTHVTDALGQQFLTKDPARRRVEAAIGFLLDQAYAEHVGRTEGAQVVALAQVLANRRLKVGVVAVPAEVRLDVRVLVRHELVIHGLQVARLRGI